MTAKKVWKIVKREHVYAREFDDTITDICIVYDVKEAKEAIASLAYKHDTDVFVWEKRESYTSETHIIVRFSSASLSKEITFEAYQIEIVE